MDKQSNCRNSGIMSRRVVYATLTLLVVAVLGISVYINPVYWAVLVRSERILLFIAQGGLGSKGSVRLNAVSAMDNEHLLADLAMQEPQTTEEAVTVVRSRGDRFGRPATATISFRDVNIAALRRLSDQELVERVACEAEAKVIRTLAIREKITNQEALSRIALKHADPHTRLDAISVLTNRHLLEQLSESADPFWLQRHAAERLETLNRQSSAGSDITKSMSDMLTREEAIDFFFGKHPCQIDGAMHVDENERLVTITFKIIADGVAHPPYREARIDKLEQTVISYMVVDKMPTVIPEAGGLSLDVPVPDDLLWPSPPKLRGITRRPNNGTYFAVLDTVGLIAPDEVLSVSTNGYTFTWRVTSIGPKGIDTERLEAKREIFPTTH